MSECNYLNFTKNMQESTILGLGIVATAINYKFCPIIAIRFLINAQDFCIFGEYKVYQQYKKSFEECEKD